MNDEMQDEYLVIKQFEEQIHDYTDPEREKGHKYRITSLLIEWIKNNENVLLNQYPLRVCEFGGGAGFVLKEIHKKLGKKVVLYNAELVEKYSSLQVLENINFVHTSILDSRFDSNYFDVVIVHDILHHLVGKSLKQTRINQYRAINELFRVVKPGGLIFIEEQVNRSNVACIILYYLTKLASKMKLRIDYFQITPHTVVGFLTQKQLIKICKQYVPLTDWFHNGYVPLTKWALNDYERLKRYLMGVALIEMQNPYFRGHAFTNK